MRTIEQVAAEALLRHPLKLLSVIGKGPYNELTKIFIAALTAERRNAATSMRSRCVEAVRGMRRSTVGITDPITEEAILRRNILLAEVEVELESVSIQEQEAKQS